MTDCTVAEVSDLEERVRVAEALTSDQVGICAESVPPIGANPALPCAFKEEGDGRGGVVDGIHCQQV